MKARTERAPVYGTSEITPPVTLPQEFELRRIGKAPADAPQVRTSGIAAGIFREILGGLDHERLIVLHVDGRHRVIGWHEAARGGGNVVHVSPREVLRLLLWSGAAAFLVAHNHPSGDPTPSVEDIELTKRMRAAGEVVGVKLLDHIIVGDGESFYSFADGGL